MTKNRIDNKQNSSAVDNDVMSTSSDFEYSEYQLKVERAKREIMLAMEEYGYSNSKLTPLEKNVAENGVSDTESVADSKKKSKKQKAKKMPVDKTKAKKVVSFASIVIFIASLVGVVQLILGHFVTFDFADLLKVADGKSALTIMIETFKTLINGGSFDFEVMAVPMILAVMGLVYALNGLGAIFTVRTKGIGKIIKTTSVISFIALVAVIVLVNTPVLEGAYQLNNGFYVVFGVGLIEMFVALVSKRVK